MGGHIVGCASLEFERQALEGGLLPRHLVNHFATTLIGRQFLQPFLLAIKYANAGRSIHLMTTESKEVAVHCLHVNGHVGCTLCSIHEDGDAVSVGCLDDVLDRVDGAQHVTDMGDTDELSPVGDVSLDGIETQTPVISDGQMLHYDAVLLGL